MIFTICSMPENPGLFLFVFLRRSAIALFR